MTRRIAIVGGGIAGLSAAFELAEAGADVALFEASRALGGHLSTVPIGGGLADAGPDAFSGAKPEGLALCRSLGLATASREARPRGPVCIARGSRFHPLPLGSGGLDLAWSAATSSLLSVRGKARALADLILPRTSLEGLSAGDWARGRMGEEAKAYLFEPLVGGILAVDVDSTDARILDRLCGRGPRCAAGAVLGLRLAAGPSHGLPLGMGELPRALAARIGQDRIRTGAPVRSIEPTPEGFRLSLGQGESVAADRILVAAPPLASSRMLAGLDPVLADQLAAQRGSPIASVLLALDGEPPLALPSTVVFFPAAERTTVFSVTCPTTAWPGRAPAGQIVLRALLGGGHARRVIADRTDRDLIALTLEDLARFGARLEPREARVVRFEEASPSLGVGVRERVEAIRERARAHGGIALLGRAMGLGLGLSSTIAEARAAARSLLSG